MDPRKSSPPPEINIPPINGRHRSINNHSSFLGRLSNHQVNAELHHNLTPAHNNMHQQRQYGSLAYSPRVDYQSLNMPVGSTNKVTHHETCITPKNKSQLFGSDKNSQSRLTTLDRRQNSQLRQPAPLAHH